MSASQKLKVLDEDSNLRRMYVWVENEERDITDQIVAVVEAAEKDMDYLTDAWRGESFVIPETTHVLVAALAALEDKLTEK